MSDDIPAIISEAFFCALSLIDPSCARGSTSQNRQALEAWFATPVAQNLLLEFKQEIMKGCVGTFAGATGGGGGGGGIGGPVTTAGGVTATGGAFVGSIATWPVSLTPPAPLTSQWYCAGVGCSKNLRHTDLPAPKCYTCGGRLTLA